MKKYKVLFAMIIAIVGICQCGYCQLISENTDGWVDPNTIETIYVSSSIIGSEKHLVYSEDYQTMQADYLTQTWVNKDKPLYTNRKIVAELIRTKDVSVLGEDTIKLFDDTFGDGNWSIDWDHISLATSGGNLDGDCKTFLPISINGNPDTPTVEVGGGNVVRHNYSGKSKSHVSESHLTAALFPNRSNYEGKESLYMLGDSICIIGSRCIHKDKYWSQCTSHTCKRTITWTSYWYDEEGIRREEKKTSTEYYTTGGCGNVSNVRYSTKAYDTKIEFDGFKVGPDKKSSLNMGGSSANWNTGALQITEVDKVYYDSAKGTYYGKIKITTGCCRNCSREFKLYFGERPDAPNGDVDNDIVKLKVKITPNQGGKVWISGIMDADKDGVLEEEAITAIVAAEDELHVVSGNSYEITSVANDGHVFKWIVTADGNVITEENPYTYTMPETDTTIVVHFTPVKAGGYNLYVTSNEGGRAWTEDRPEGTNYSPIMDGDKQIGDKISGVKAGTGFSLKYEAAVGYEFDRWEYRPFISDEYSDGTTQIKMPDSDLTATAIFKKSSVELKNRKPILKVNSNNEEWGTAYAIVNGNPVSISSVEPAEEYQLVFQPEPGYYFTNWDYDSDKSPFKDAENKIIVMPNYDVKITAFFAPIPTQDIPKSAGNVAFVAETITPADGIVPGTVPENLTNIAAGAEVTFGVTANMGWKFLYWYFTDTQGNIETPDKEYTEYGSGKFVMPNYDIVAHAVFGKLGDGSVKVEIVGNGVVSSEGEEIPSGTIITRPDGDIVELVATPEDGWRFVHWTDEDGNILSEDESFKYTIDGDTVIIAVFGRDSQYTLYITSMEGGNAETEGNENHPMDSIIATIDDLGKKVYKIENVYEGEVFEIYYTLEDGYTFNKWEYKPWIEAESDVKTSNGGVITIRMPASDLTVTATFKNTQKDDAPEIRVTSNNADWGSAWTIIGNKQTKMDETYPANIGDKYELNYEAEDEYYFVNWAYSTNKSPFVSEDVIEMPDSDLEVMALFAPVPTPSTPPAPGQEKHEVDFSAEPPEGGSVPEDLIGDKAIYAGCKVTIGVTPNEGWEFDYWYFKNNAGEIIEVELHVDADGSGYFIMPDEDVEAIAVFRKTGRYKLYVTYTAGGEAWVMDGDTQTKFIPDAIPEKIYNLGYTVKDGYQFVGWEFRWDKYGANPPEGIQPHIYQDENKAVMPYSDMTVTAKFEKIEEVDVYKLRVISNNYLWGDAWIEIDGALRSWKEIIGGEVQQNANDEEGIVIETDKDYKVYYEANDGYIFTNWLPAEYFIYTDFNDKEGYGIINIPAEYLTKDIELTAYFKPGESEELYDLTVSTNPENAGTVTGAKQDIKYGESFEVKVVDVNNGYKFKYWYYEKDGERIVVTYDKKYDGKMPPYDLELVAYFEEIEDGETGELGPGDEITYQIVVKINGSGEVRDTLENIVTRREMKDGESIVLIATPAEGYIFTGWKINGNIVYTDSEQKFTIDGENIVVTACFIEKPEIVVTDGFKIISVRDLRWKNYFINGNKLTDRVFIVPKENTTMLQKVGNNDYPDVLKMGYAVEFELTTSQLIPEKTVLVIYPKIISNGREIPWSQVTDALSKEQISSDFGKVVINGNGSTNKYTNMYQTSVKVDHSVKNQGVDINKMTWNWLYYLPADIDFNNSGDEIIIRFNIELHETADGKTYNSSTLKQNFVLFEQKYSGIEWKGDVYKYSMTESLLDDIYNNAT